MLFPVATTFLWVSLPFKAIISIFHIQESRVFRDFEIQKPLGSGGFGFVLQVQHIMDTKKYALKLTLSNDRHAAKEVEFFAKLPAHENVVAYTTAWEDIINYEEIKCLATIGFYTSALGIPQGVQQLPLLCIQMELCGQDLRHWLDNQTTVDDTKCKNIFLQILKGVQHIHDQNLIHRDLKPDNIFFTLNDPARVKIGDFGIAAIHDDSAYIEHTKAIETVLYMAPEQRTRYYDKRVDLFAMGLILFEIYHPPAQLNLKESIDNLRNKKKFPKEFKSNWPKVTRAISSLLQDDPKKRPSIAALTEFFSGKAKENDKGSMAKFVDRLSIGLTNGYQLKEQEKSQPNFDERRPSTHGTACIACEQPIKGLCYKCNTCDDFNYCNQCYKTVAVAVHRSHHQFTEIRKASSDPSSPLVVGGDTVHHGIECTGCEDIQIRGRRYKCQTCTNVNFCRKCYVSEVSHRMNHVFSLILICSWHQTACKPPQTDVAPDAGHRRRSLAVEHHGIRCHKCKVSPITGIRYSCKSCPFVDYCESCYKSTKHKIKHIFRQITKCAVHNVACQHCKKGIVGSRYKCTRCQNYDYCYTCYYKCERHRKMHDFYVFHEITN